MMHQVLALTVLCWATGATPAASWAERLFDDLAHDFGVVPRGPILVHPFRVTNSTGRPLRIASVRTSCGCVPASVTKNELAPGETAEVIVKMNTRRFSGVSKKTIFVLFDRPQVEEVRLTVQADCRDDFFITPETLAFGRVRPGDPSQVAVTVSIVGDAGVKVTAAGCDSSYVQVAVRQLPHVPGEASCRVTAQLRPGLLAGHWYATVWLTTDSPALPRLLIPVTVEVKSP